jgi:hypothetical protein
MCKRRTIGSPLGEPLPLSPGAGAAGTAHAANKNAALAAAPRKKLRRESAECCRGEFVDMVSPLEAIMQGDKTNAMGVE